MEVDGVCGSLVLEVAKSMRGRHYHRKLLIGKEFPEPRNGLGRAHLPQSRRRCDANFRLGIIERMPGEVAGVNVVAQQAQGTDAIRPLAGFPRRSRGVQHVPGFLGACFTIVSGLNTEGQQSSPGKTGNRQPSKSPIHENPLRPAYACGALSTRRSMPRTTKTCTTIPQRLSFCRAEETGPAALKARNLDRFTVLASPIGVVGVRSCYLFRRC